MTEREIFEKYDHLSKDELNTKINKKKNRWIKKKIDDSRI